MTPAGTDRTRLQVRAARLESTGVSVGFRAPQFELPEPLTGKIWTLDDFEGSPALLFLVVFRNLKLSQQVLPPLKKHDQCMMGTEDEQCVNLEEQTVQLEKDLRFKERARLDVLKELESANRIIADLQLKLLKKKADAIEPVEPEDKYCITQVPTADHEERLPEGNAEADVDMCGGLDKQEQQKQYPVSPLTWKIKCNFLVDMDSPACADVRSTGVVRREHSLNSHRS